jgi:gluconokinase
MVKIMIGVDIGTTSTKVVGLRPDGSISASANHGYHLIQNEPGQAEEEPRAIMCAVMSGLQEVIATSQRYGQTIAGIAFSAAMHSFLLLDAQYRPLTDVITWADNRAVHYADLLQQDADAENLVARTGVPIHPMSPLVKAMWLNATQPLLFNQAHYYSGIKEYVIHELCQQFISDYSTAGASGMFNLSALDWDEPALSLAHIHRSALPRLVDTEFATPLTATMATELGLSEPVPVIVGASDGCLSNLGLGAVQPGDIALTIGTSGAVRSPLIRRVPNPVSSLFTYYLAPDVYIQGGPVNNGGNVLKWISDTFFSEQNGDYDAIMQAIATVPAGSHNLIFLPYLDGERAPLWDWYARGSYIGLTAQHTRADMARSALEGVTFGLRSVLTEVANQSPTPITRILATGGFAQSPVWRQLLADALGQSLTIPVAYESSALGAALLGFHALGLRNSIVPTPVQIGGTSTCAPNASVAEFYTEWFALWQQASAATQPTMHAIASFHA